MQGGCRFPGLLGARKMGATVRVVACYVCDCSNDVCGPYTVLVHVWLSCVRVSLRIVSLWLSASLLWLSLVQS
jgi:hypothetical protein